MAVSGGGAGAFMQSSWVRNQGWTNRELRDMSMYDKEPDLLGAPAEVTPARTFFVRMVAQREVEVNEKEWLGILQRHGSQRSSGSTATTTMSSSNLSSYRDNTSPDSAASSSTAALTTSHRAGPRRTSSGVKGVSERSWRHQTSNIQILKVPLHNNEEIDEMLSAPKPKKSRQRIPILEVLSPFSIWYASWQYFMMFVDFTYTAFWVPYSVVFVLEDCLWNQPSAILDFAVGWLYVLDIIVNLRVGYSVVFKLSRTVELDSLRSALFYITNGTFIVDLPATIPVFVQTICLGIAGAESNFGINITQMMRLLRLLRLARALRLLLSDALDVASVSVKRATGAKMVWFQFLQIVILFAWTAHLMACAWYYTAVMEDSAYYDKWPHKQGQIWSCIEGEEDDGPTTWLKTAGILCAPNGIKYMAAFYFSTMTITTVGYGDISADTTSEQAVATVMMFFGAIFFGYLVSTTTLFLEKCSSQRKEIQSYHDKIELVDSWVRNREIPKRLNMKIRSFYSIVWSKARDLQTEKKILQELPFPLRAAAAEHITLPMMEQILCLSHVNHKHWKHISRRFRAEWYPPGKFIAHSEGRGSGEGLRPEIDSLWLLERGKIACVKHDKGNISLVGPQVFGCSLILQLLDEDVPLETSFNTYMSTTPVWLWRINKEYLQTYFGQNPGALVEFCEGLLVDMEQLKLLQIDTAMESRLYTKIMALKEQLPEDEILELSLPRGASKQHIYTIQEGGKWANTSLNQ